MCRRLLLLLFRRRQRKSSRLPLVDAAAADGLCSSQAEGHAARDAPGGGAGAGAAGCCLVVAAGRPTTAPAGRLYSSGPCESSNNGMSVKARHLRRGTKGAGRSRTGWRESTDGQNNGQRRVPKRFQNQKSLCSLLCQVVEFPLLRHLLQLYSRIYRFLRVVKVARRINEVRSTMQPS